VQFFHSSQRSTVQAAYHGRAPGKPEVIPLGWQIAPDALVTSNRARSRMVAYPPIPKCSQQLAAPGMEKLAVVLWWHFHLMRQFVAIFSSHGVGAADKAVDLAG
jgi:hypothetical protein